MKKVFLICFIVAAGFSANSQAIASNSGSGAVYLNKNESGAGGSAKKRGYYVGPHVLGDTITALLNKFENYYVYYEESGGAYSVEEKIIIKPQIYKAVKRVNKYYEKGFDKGTVPRREAYASLKSVLTKSIKLRDYYTENVERDLKKMKDGKEIVEYIDKIILR